MSHDQVSFYDETLKKQIEGSFTSDGKSIHVSSAYGIKSVPYNDLGPENARPGASKVWYHSYLHCMTPSEGRMAIHIQRIGLGSAAASPRAVARAAASAPGGWRR